MDVPNNTFGIFEANSTYVQSDMDQFFKEVAPQIPVGTMAKNVLINGVQVSANLSAGAFGVVTGVESDLDFQLAWPLIYPQNITLFAALPTQVELTNLVLSNMTVNQKTYTGLNLILDDVFKSFDGVMLQLLISTLYKRLI